MFKITQAGARTNLLYPLATLEVTSRNARIFHSHLAGCERQQDIDIALFYKSQFVKMTTTELYSGYTADGKPSSRVLRPPGGASSNIFGAPEPNPQQQVRQEQQKEAQKTQSPNPQGSAQSNPTNDAKQEYNRNKPKGRVQYNPITGEEYPASYGQKGKEEKKVEQETEDKKDEDSADENANEETAEENSNNNIHNTPKPEEVKPASAQFQKVRQPPGGKSSGLW